MVICELQDSTASKLWNIFSIILLRSKPLYIFQNAQPSLTHGRNNRKKGEPKYTIYWIEKKEKLIIVNVPD